MLCYLATGVNDWDDLSNPYYYIEASWSISEAILYGVTGPAGQLEKITVKTITKVIYTEEFQNLLKHALVKNNLNGSISKLFAGYLEGKLFDLGLDTLYFSWDPYEVYSDNHV